MKVLLGAGDPRDVIVAPVGSRYVQRLASDRCQGFLKTRGSDARGWQPVGAEHSSLRA